VKNLVKEASATIEHNCEILDQVYAETEREIQQIDGHADLQNTEVALNLNDKVEALFDAV